MAARDALVNMEGVVSFKPRSLQPYAGGGAESWLALLSEVGAQRHELTVTD